MASRKCESKGRLIAEELEDCEFGDERLGLRFKKLVNQLASQPGASISVACEDWSNVKAAYRFLSNARVNEKEILSGHFASTRRRFAGEEVPVLVLHDTTEFVYKRADVSSIGLLKSLPKAPAMRGAFGAPHLTTCGILLHSSLIVTTSGVPLGLGAVKFWTRDRFKGTNALKRKVNTTRIPIEQKESVRWLENIKQSTALLQSPNRCVHIGDRESDIYELFCTAEQLQTSFLVRTCVDRLAGQGDTLVSEELSQSPVRGTYCLTVTDKDKKERQVKLEIKFKTLQICPPADKKKRYSPLTLTVIEATERKPGKGCQPIVWKLLTNLTVNSLGDAKEKRNRSRGERLSTAEFFV